MNFFFIYAISLSAVLAFEMASLAVVICSTLLSEPFLPSSIWHQLLVLAIQFKF